MIALLSLTLVLPARAGLVAHWPLDANANDASGNSRHLQLQNGATITNGAGQFIIGTGALGGEGTDGQLDGQDDRGSANGLESGAVAYNGISGANARTVSAWVKNYAYINGTTTNDPRPTIVSWGSGSTPNGERFDVRISNGGFDGFDSAPSGRVRVEINGGGTAANTNTTLINDTNWHHVMVSLPAGTNDPTFMTIYVDGQAVAATRFNTALINTTPTWPVAVGDSMMADEGTFFDRNFEGWIDDVAIFDDSDAGNASVGATVSAAILNGLGRVAGRGIADLAAAQNIWLTGTPAVINGTTWYRRSGMAGVLGDYGGSVGGGTGYIVLDNSGNGISVAQVAPTINANPASFTNAVGGSASFTVGAVGTLPINYQWYFISNGVSTNLLVNATNTTFTRNPLALTHSGDYFAVASNSFGQATSQVATLVVFSTTPPSISSNPVPSQTIIKGLPASFSVTAAGSTPLSYQWRKGGVPIGGATATNYSIASTGYADQGSYDVVVTNLYGSVTSAVSVLTIRDVTPPVINNATNITVAPASPAGTIVSFGFVTATDDRDGGLPVTFNPPSGSLLPPGVTVVSASATDAGTNTSVAYFTVTVLGIASVQTIFADNYTVSGNSFDINFEYNAGRQSGVLAPIPYTELTRHQTYGSFDDYTQVENSSYPGTLYLKGLGASAFAAATLAHEFLESPTYTVEVEVNPGSTTNWAAIAIGSPYAHVFPNSTVTGFGLLFRGTGQLSVFDGTTTVFNSSATNYLGTVLPAPPYTVRLEVASSGFGTGTPAIIKAFVNGTQIRLATNALTYIKPAGFTNNFIVLSANAQTGTAEAAFDNLVITAVPSIFASHPDIATVVGASNQTFEVIVPPSLVATSAVNVVLSNSNPSAAKMVGESGGLLTLNFTSGGTNKKTVTVSGEAAGSATLTLSSPSLAVPIGGKPVTVKVTAPPTYIANASFENSPLPGFPGYGSIPGWTASDTNWVGVSPNLNVGGVLGNDRVSGHGKNVALIKCAGPSSSFGQTLSTTISNLTIGKKYQLSFLANNQNGSVSVALLDVLLNGIRQQSTTNSQLGTVGAAPLGFVPVAVAFTATSPTATLTITNSTGGAGTTGLLVDDFQLKEIRGVWNYEVWTNDVSSGISNTVTYTHAYNLGEALNVTLNGVTFTGVAGGTPVVSNVFSFNSTGTAAATGANNKFPIGSASTNLAKALVNGNNNPRLTLQGLTPGAQYRLKLFGAGFANVDANDGRRVGTWSGGGESLTVDENIFGRGVGIVVNYDFVAAGSTEVVEQRAFVAGNTWHLLAFANQLVADRPSLSISLVAGPQVRLAWPAAASFYRLQSAAVVTGPYTDVGAAPAVEGNELAVYQPLGAAQYYRLIAP